MSPMDPSRCMPWETCFVNVLFVSQQLAALLVSGNVSPWLIAYFGAAAMSQCWQGAGLGQSLSSTLFSACSWAYVLINMSCLLLLIYARFFWGDSLMTVSVLGWFSMDELSSCSATFAAGFGFVVRFCSWVCMWAMVLLWGDTLVAPL